MSWLENVALFVGVVVVWFTLAFFLRNTFGSHDRLVAGAREEIPDVERDILLNQERHDRNDAASDAPAEVHEGSEVEGQTESEAEDSQVEAAPEPPLPPMYQRNFEDDDFEDDFEDDIKLEAIVGRNEEQSEPGDYRVWFGTNRQPLDENDPRSGFSNEHSESDTTYYGRVTVHIPKSHKIGSIGSSLIWRLITLQDDRLKLRSQLRMEEVPFWTAVMTEVLAVDEGLRHAVVFIHGYNVSFEEAAIRAAQIGKDLSISGAMAFFSWPSKACTDGYAADGASIEASEGAIADFLVDFAHRSGADAVHIIAHSMGNRGLLRAMARIAANADWRSDVKFGQFILAAPDVDSRTFKDLSRHYKAYADRTTLYCSSKDKAVALSAWLHDYPRIGFAPPIGVFPDVDTINVTNVDLTLVGHGYVGSARDVLQDMHRLIFQNIPPGQRFGLRLETNDEGAQYWVIGP